MSGYFLRISMFITTFLLVLSAYSQDYSSAITEKLHDAELLAQKAVEYLEHTSLYEACHHFAKDIAWRKGDLSVMVFNKDGVIFVDVHEPFLTWKKPGDADVDLQLPMPYILELVERGGGWIDYPHNKRLRLLYVRQALQDNAQYVVGVGFFAESTQLDTYFLVRSTLNYFKDHGAQATIKAINNPEDPTLSERLPPNPFIRGNFYVSVIDYHGNTVADARGMAQPLSSPDNSLINQKIVQKAQEGGGWITYSWGNTLKRTLVAPMYDANTNTYYAVASGYFPEITDITGPELVHRAARFLKRQGKARAFKEFAQRFSNFRVGDLTLKIFDLQGRLVLDADYAHAHNTHTLSYLNNPNQSFIQEMVQIARTENHGSVNFIAKHGNHVLYFERVKQLIVATDYIPNAKERTVEALVRSGADYLKKHDPYTAFREFKRRYGRFSVGDVYLFVYDAQGTCFVHDAHSHVIWHNFIDFTDQQGTPILTTLFNTLKTQPEGWAQFVLNNGERRVFAMRCDTNSYYSAQQKRARKRTRSYLIGAGYYV